MNNSFKNNKGLFCQEVKLCGLVNHNQLPEAHANPWLHLFYTSNPAQIAKQKQHCFNFFIFLFFEIKYFKYKTFSLDLTLKLLL